MKKIISTLLISSLLFSSCEKDLQFDDPNKLTYEEYLQQPGAAVKVASGAVIGLMDNVLNGAYGMGLMLMSDQISSTNRYVEFWDFAQEPRKALTNSDTYGGYGHISSYWGGFAQANLDANNIILKVRAGEQIKDVAGTNRTQDALAAAFFAKGVSNGYIGALYDRGVIVNGPSADVAPFSDYPNSYKELVENGVKHLDSAIAVATSASSLTFDFIPGLTISKTQFIAWCNGMAARIMASAPRDLAEAKALGATYWNKVYDYASKSPSSDVLYTYTNESVYPGTIDWAISLLGDGAGYLPVDIKVAYLVDKTGTHPKYYPSTGVLAPVSTDDKRFYNYFGYDPDFGFLRADRNRGLFTNYYRVRWDNADNTVAVPGSIAPFWQNEERTLLMAEAKMFAGDMNAAAALINNASYSRKALGELPDVAATESALRNAIHWEYSVCIDAGSGPLPVFAYMRRNDLLIGGTATQLPVPVVQMQVLGGKGYSFGGIANAGAKGKFNETATAANVGWKASQ